MKHKTLGLCAVAGGVVIAAALIFTACGTPDVPGADAAECHYQMLKTGTECAAYDSAFVKNRPEFKIETRQMLAALGPLKSYKLVSHADLDAQESVIDGKYGVLNYECEYENDRTQETLLFVVRKGTGRATLLNVAVNPSRLRL